MSIPVLLHVRSAAFNTSKSARVARVARGLSLSSDHVPAGVPPGPYSQLLSQELFLLCLCVACCVCVCLCVLLRVVVLVVYVYCACCFITRGCVCQELFRRVDPDGGFPEWESPD